MIARNLAGKVALVTGGGRGIGAAVARRLAAAGADVGISYLNSVEQAEAVVEELSETGVRAAAFKADQAKSDEVKGMVRSAAEHFGQLDVLVNNAGVLRMGILGETDPDEVAELWAINVESVVTATREAVPYMKAGGRVILISSLGANAATAPGMGDYTAGKAAVSAYGRSWAHDLASRGITCNTLELGPIDTDMVIPADSDFGRTLVGTIPMGRYGRPEEIANVVAFIAGPESSYMTGSSIRVDGGFSS